MTDTNHTELFAALQGQVKLRKVETRVRPTITPNENVILKEEEDYWRTFHATYFEHWFEHIQHLTFKSVHNVPLTPSVSRALVSAYNEFKKKPSFDWTTMPELVELATQLDAEKELLGCDTIFVRLSSRSPKDAVAYRPDFTQVFETTLKSIEEEEASQGYDTGKVNRAILALYIACTQTLASKSGKDAVDLLTKSERIQGDLENHLNEGKEAMNFIVREFIQFLPEFELRVFVNNGKLTAISQYNHMNYSKKLVDNVDTITKLMEAYITNELIPSLKMNSFVLDTILISQTPDQGHTTNLKPYVIEVNPFGEMTGPALFSWEEDRKVLTGEAPYEFRLNREVKQGAWRELTTEWQDWVRKYADLPEKTYSL